MFERIKGNILFNTLLENSLVVIKAKSYKMNELKTTVSLKEDVKYEEVVESYNCIVQDLLEKNFIERISNE